MGRSFGFLVLIVVVGFGAYVYTRQAQTGVTVGTSALTTIDVTAVHNDLQSMARAEQQYFAANGKYVGLDELEGMIHIPVRQNYSYAAQPGLSGFKIVATYSGPDPKAPKHISVDETLSIRNN
jgi:hypothetical protein